MFNMSNVVVELPYKTGAPFSASCDNTMPARTSQLCTTKVPARVMGVVPPDIAMERILHGTPARARFMMISQHSSLSCKGLVGHVRADIIGRSLNLSIPPTIAAAILIYLLTLGPQVRSMCIQCFDVLVRNAFAS